MEKFLPMLEVEKKISGRGLVAHFLSSDRAEIFMEDFPHVWILIGMIESR